MIDSRHVFLYVDSIVETDRVVAVRVGADVDNMYYSTTAAAVCDPADKFDSETGRKLALGRAIRQLGRELLQEGHYLVHEADRARESQAEAAAVARKLKAKRIKEAKKSVKKKAANKKG